MPCTVTFQSGGRILVREMEHFTISNSFSLLSYGSIRPNFENDDDHERFDELSEMHAIENDPPKGIGWRLGKWIGIGVACVVLLLLFGKPASVSTRDIVRVRNVASVEPPPVPFAQQLEPSHLAAVKSGADPTTLIGFASNIFSPQNLSGKLFWYCAPDSWKSDASEKKEGSGGSWALDGSSLVVTPPAKKDYWRKTYYDPIIIKDDAPFLYAKLSASEYYTVETVFELTAVRQFDQAGLMVRLGPEHWLKAGIEVVDQQPRLSCVVTNGYSDWSTQTWTNFTINTTSKVVQVGCHIRVHCRGTSFVVEAKMPQANEWQFIRIAHLSRCMGCQDGPFASLGEDGTLIDASPAADGVWAGVFAASPEDQQGGHARFTKFEILPGSHFEHNANGNEDS